jgi:enoyl-CoA hydratase/carnithine racemase
MNNKVLSDLVLLDIQDGVATLTFNRPQARNAFTMPMYARLAQLCRELPANPEIKVIVMSGAGDKAFASGTEISEFRDVTTHEHAVAYETTMEAIFQTIEACPLPTIAAINGACTGGGAAIAAVCDMRIATRSARFGFPIARTLGNSLSVLNYARLVTLIGAARTKELIFTARLLDADEGLAWGIYNEVVADHAALIARTHALAQLIAGHAPLTLKAAKESLLRVGRMLSPQDNFDLAASCYASDDFREGMTAFLEKRAPRWTGR